jgi:nitrogen fixation NifU-like protein
MTDDLKALYQQTIVAHDRAPHHEGPLSDATHAATIDNPLCGDVCTLRLRLVDGRVADVAFEGRGCALSRAGASILTTLAAGQDAPALRALAAGFTAFVAAPPDATITDAERAQLGELTVFAGARRFRARHACATLATRALLAALDAHP